MAVTLERPSEKANKILNAPQPQIEIRQYQPEDYDAALALWQQSGQRPFSSEAVDRLMAGGGDALVAELCGEESRVVGVGLWSHNGDMAFLWRLVVDQSVRRCGIAQSIVERIEQDVRKAGFAALGLLARDANEPAQALYTGRGYKRRQELEFWAKRVEG
jgi:ribosomal protein S18 acetylase RimI-like enzyme